MHSKLKTVTGVLSDSIFCRNCQSWIQLSCLSKHCIWWLLFRNKKCWPLTFLFLFYSYNTWVCVHNGGLGYISISYHNSNLIQRGKFCQVARRGSSDRQDAISFKFVLMFHVWQWDWSKSWWGYYCDDNFLLYTLPVKGKKNPCFINCTLFTFWMKLSYWTQKMHKTYLVSFWECNGDTSVQAKGFREEQSGS